jgi:hypothetical protein
MTKLVLLLAMGLMIGCSNAAKKQTSETNTTPAAAPAAAPMTATTPVPVELKSETKKTKGKAPKATAETTGATSTAAEVTCTADKEVRKLAIKAKDKGCELEYTKAGQPSSVASQIIGQTKCEEVSTHIQEKLVAAGYTCQ